MKSVRRGVVSLLLLVVPLTAPGAGLQSLEQGTWDLARGMTGSISAADSAATAYYNPAAMTWLPGDQPIATGGIMGIIGESRFKPGSANTVSGSTGGNQSGNTVAPAGPFFVYPVNEDLALGFSVAAPFVGSLNPSDGWVGRYQLRDLSLAVYRAAPAIAYQVTDWLSVGGSVGINYADLEMSAALPFPAADGNLKIDDADQWEPNFSLNAYLEPFDGTRLGVTYVSKTDLDDLGGDVRVTGAPGLVNTDVTVEFTLPQLFAVGVRQEVGERLLLFGTVGWADFSQFDSIFIDVSDTDAVDAATHFRDTVAYGFGLDYMLSPAWTLSMGASYASSPVRSKNRNAALPFDRQYRYGAGVRYRWSEQTNVGLSYEYLDLGKGRLSAISPPGSSDRLQGKYDENYVQFIALTLSKAF